MILLNGINEVPFGHFPDGTLMMNNFPVNSIQDRNIITWEYASEEELIVLIYTVNHIRSCKKDAEIILLLPYIPNARMDRTKHNTEVFTLKYFASIINSLNFNEVRVLDPHSDVSVALLNNVKLIDVDNYISRAVNDFNNMAANDFVVFFPDAGAFKRYKDIECLEPFTKIYGQKVRDWDTGQIKGLKIVDGNGERLDTDNPKPLEGKTVLMIDDIISYGGTFHFSAAELNKLGAKNINAYATHVESGSMWDPKKGVFGKDLIYGLVDHLYTTSSIYRHNEDELIDKVTVFML